MAEKIRRKQSATNGLIIAKHLAQENCSIKTSFRSICITAVWFGVFYDTLKLQKRAARLIYDLPGREHSVPLFKKLEWLPVNKELAS